MVVAQTAHVSCSCVFQCTLPLHLLVPSPPPRAQQHAPAFAAHPAYIIPAEVVHRALNFNSPPGKDATSESYKVLVLDRFTKDIIAPLLRLNDLRKHGVTLHLMIENERQPIPDVPAVYFVQPTQSNIDRIVADAAAGLYDTMYLNFTTSVNSKLVEQLAAGAVKAGALQRISKLYDQYMSFIALEPSLFSLGLPDSYLELNDPQARDYQIEVGHEPDAADASIAAGTCSAGVGISGLHALCLLAGGTGR